VFFSAARHGRGSRLHGIIETVVWMFKTALERSKVIQNISKF
jgi:hypothetical protein